MMSKLLQKIKESRRSCICLSFVVLVCPALGTVIRSGLRLAAAQPPSRASNSDWWILVPLISAALLLDTIPL